MKDRKIWRVKNMESTYNDFEIDESKSDENDNNEKDDNNEED